jgi:hypothetical protein
MEVVLFLLVALLTGTLGAFGQFLSDLIGSFGGLFPM